MPHSKAFNEIFKNVKKEYLGKPVPEKYQFKYGKTFDKKEVKSVAFAIAKSRGIKIDKWNLKKLQIT